MADNNITEEEIKSYFANFHSEQLTSDEENQQLLISFCANEYGTSLEEYLKKSAWVEDNARHTKVYLIKNVKNSIVAYFAIKCGLLYEPRHCDIRTEEEKIFLDSILEAISDANPEDIKKYREAGVATLGYEREDYIFNYAQEQIKFQQEKKTGGEKSFNVEMCHPAIELSHFCKAKENVDTVRDIPFGVGLFWEIIVPIIIKIANTVGCKYLYLFAADMSDSTTQKLVEYYKVNLKFKIDESLIFIKPKYDMGCRCLCQSIADLENNKKWIWQQFIGDL